MPDVEITTNQKSDWTILWEDISRRTSRPLSSIPFLVYVLIAIVLFGGLGIWAELLRMIVTDKFELSGLITAIITFFPTLIGTTTLQLILASSNRGEKVMTAFAILILFLFLVAAILLPFFRSTHPEHVLAIGIGCSLASIWVWWMTNGLDQTFHSNRPDDASGGDTSREPQGNLKGIKS